MTFTELFLTAVALSMDAMAVSISSGIAARHIKIRNALLMAAFFGGFQALMPLIGYYIVPLLSKVFGDGVTAFVEGMDHWIALVLLSFIGGKMIIEAIKNDEEAVTDNPFKLGTLFVMAIATSIDALATGIVFRGFSLTGGGLVFTILSIGFVTFILSLVGVLLGKKLGEKFKRWAVLGGGIVLVCLGIKVFLEHVLT